MMNEAMVRMGDFFSEVPDLVWTALISFVVAKVTLYWERKQTARFRKQDVKLQYVSKCMSWLNDLQMRAYIVSDKGAECLDSLDVPDLGKRYGEFNAEANRMMEKCLVGISAYELIAKVLNINIDFEEVRTLTGVFIRDMRTASKERYNGAEDEAAKLINKCTGAYVGVIEEKIKIVGNVLKELLENN